MFTEETYIAHQVAFFKKNATKEPCLLGMEFEHFLIDERDLRSYKYEERHGQRDLFERLMGSGWNCLTIEDGQILGIEKNGHTLTLEPGGQVEISLKPYVTLAEIDEAYSDLLKEIGTHLKPGQRLVSIGYHPHSRIDDLPLLPKKRYGMMYDYFKENGRYCHNMMKGTAATQVSIDYADETDFVKKFRVANFLSPVMASLFDAVPVFEGSMEAEGNRRLRIWNETDLKRSKLIPGSLDNRFGFEAYAKYLLTLPPILIQSEGAIHQTGDRKLKDLIGAYVFTDKDLEHLQSMVFPDVRLKRFIEIRMPDAMPHPYNLAVAALVKGIFYDKTNLETFYTLSLNYGDEWVEAMNQSLIVSELNQRMPELEALKEQVIRSALEVLEPADQGPLLKFQALLNSGSSLLEALQSLLKNDLHAFLDFVTVAKYNDKEVL